jgi:signal transduction histidine kinase
MKNKSIIQNVNRAMLIGVVVQAIFIYALYAFRYHAKIEAERELNVRSTANVLEKLLVRPIGQGDYILAESYINVDSFPRYIQSITVTSVEGDPIVSSRRSSLCKNKELVHKQLLSSDFLGRESSKIGTLNLTVTNCDIVHQLKSEFKLTFFLLIISLGLIYFFTKKGLNNSLLPLRRLMNTKTYENNDRGMIELAPIELRPILTEMSNSHQVREELSLKKSQIHFSRQIAHDIRSPLEALKLVSESIDSIDTTTKTILTNSTARIADIANGLLKIGTEFENQKQDVFNLRMLLDEVISNKKFERKVTINFTSKSSYSSTFIEGVEGDIYRSVSNLLNNAIEAKTNSRPTDVSLSDDNRTLTLKITDYGKGMSPELLSQVLQGGVTTKEKGNGLGLSSSKKVFEDSGATFEVSSKEGEGTTIIITFTQVEAPGWFIDHISLAKRNVICIDDDISFLELYKEKMKNIEVEIQLFENDIALEKLDENNHTQFFVDYDLGASKTGLDIIIDYDICDKATLVTSMYQDKDIQKSCLENGISILPKQIFNQAKVITKNLIDTQNILDDYLVLIDDDKLIHMSWEYEAKKLNKNISCYFSVSEFISDESFKLLDKQTPIYVDSNLGDNLKGEVESKKVYEAGFENIYLATGYSSNDIDRPKWIKEIVGKRAPFSK